MQIFSMQDLFNVATLSYKMFAELKGTFAEEALKLIFLPFHDGFSASSCIIAIGWIYIFWNNKGLIYSGLSHMFHVFEWTVGLFRHNSRF
jgi:uncharacterized membrane protein